MDGQGRDPKKGRKKFQKMFSYSSRKDCFDQPAATDCNQSSKFFFKMQSRTDILVPEREGNGGESIECEHKVENVADEKEHR